MSKFFRLAIMLAMLAVSLPVFAKDDIPVEIQKKLQESMALGSTSQGYEFYIAVPPNETANFAYGSLDVYVSSTKPTEVSLQLGSTNSLISKKKIIKPLGVITFTSAAGEMNFKSNEVRVPEIVQDMGLRIVSSVNPISVYVLNSKNTTSDGYMAIPTSSWGTDYIHVAYFDKKEGFDNQMNQKYFGSGFIIVASEDQTIVQIELRGRGADFSSTTSGRKPGDPAYEVMMNKGQVYLVQGAANEIGQFDLTGTRIKSDKPIGLISYHQRTDIPSFIGSSRDHLCEMIPPVQAWGKKYATIEFNRKDKGDLFRLVASEPKTKYSLVWYDKNTNEVLGRRDGTLQRSGDFADFSEIMSMPPTGYASVRGVALFEANKPIFVMHYSYSASWDGDNRFDPFMVCVASVEQFTKTTIFQTPGHQFTNNNFNLIAIGDTNNWPNHVKLIESIKLDGKPVHTLVPRLKQNRIPNTNLFWAQLKVNPGAHYIVGDTPFGGYIYGYTSVDSYGWPAAMAINILDQTDTLAPEIFVDGTCGDYSIHYTELRNGAEGDDPKQVDLGVSEQPTLLEGSFNFNDPDFNFGFFPNPPNYDNTFKLRVTDLKEDAYALIGITDRAGNVGVKEIFYNAAKMSMDPELVQFANVRVNTTKDLNVLLKNLGTSNVEILSIEFKSGSVFSFVNKPIAPFVINNGEDLGLDLRYAPTKESLSSLQLDQDSIIILTECLRFAFPVEGRGVMPRISVPDWDAGTLVVGDKKCLYTGLKITNPGTQDLVITGFDWAPNDPAFKVTDPTDPPMPITIPAGGTIYLKTICFEPIEQKSTFTATMIFKSNAGSGRDTSILKGRSVQPGPEITSYDWGRRRVLDAVSPAYQGEVYVSNSGTSDIRFETAVLMLNATTPYTGADYKIVGYDPEITSGYIDIYPQTDTDPTHYKQVKVKLAFDPKVEGNEPQIEIHPVFAVKDKIEKGSVVGILTAEAFLPKIDAEGYVFVGAVLQGELHPDNAGTIRIESMSTTADLHIISITKVEVTTDAADDFKFAAPMPNDIILKTGEPLVIPVTFTPTRTGRREIRLDIVSDGYKAIDSIQTLSITVLGFGLDQGLNATNIDFGRITRCDDPIKTFRVINEGTTTAITIDSIVVESDYSDLFIIQNFSQGDIVDPESEREYGVRLDPLARAIQGHNSGKITAKATVYTSIGAKEIEFTGQTIITQLALKSDRIGGMTAGMITGAPYKDYPVHIAVSPNASLTGNWTDANITKFTVEITYNPRWMQFKGTVTPGTILNGWTVTGVELIHSETSATLIVTGTGTNPIAADGVLFNPIFLIMLSDSSQFTPEYGKISFGDRDSCVTSISTNGNIALEQCVQDLRNIKIDRNNFSMIPISPNPVSQNVAKLQFSVGLNNVYTKIEIINSMGEVVRTLQDGEMNSGSYEATIITSELSSGTYYINMVSGPFSSREPLVIVK